MSVCIVLVASFFYRDLSSLLIPDDPSRQSVISPVVSSAVCDGCRIENLTEPVTIFFDMTNEVTTSVVVVVVTDNDVHI